MGAEYCDERVFLSVCVCVCLSVRNRIFEHVRSSPFFVPVTCGRDAVLPWRRSECTSGFYRAMLCIRGTSHGPVSVRLSVRRKSEFY